jgi:hypothetical protein
MSVATCEICKGTGNTFHPGQAAPVKCWKCEQYGNHVDAVVSAMRARKLILSQANAVACRIFPGLQAWQYKLITEKAKERLQ